MSDGVDTVLTGYCGGVSGGLLHCLAQASFRFDYSDVRLMGVTSLPRHNLEWEPVCSNCATWAPQP